MEVRARRHCGPRGVRAAMTGAALCAVLIAALLGAGCGVAEGPGEGSPPPSAQSTAAPSAEPTAGGDLVDQTTGGLSDETAAVDRAEIERRLALPRFTYVAETDIRTSGGTSTFRGALAFIDSETDRLLSRPRMGTRPEAVAVAPDGRLVYVGDADVPVVHVVDAETKKEVRTVRLPGVKAFDQKTFTVTGKMCFADMQGCTSAIACTPDGAAVLVLSKAGLQVIDTTTFEVVRTLAGLKDGFDLAVSFDGTRAYIATLDYLGRGEKSLLAWADLQVAGVGGGLALLDLASWRVVKRVKCGVIGGMAVDPDDSRVFVSDFKLQSLRAVDPVSLSDLFVVDLKSGKSNNFQPRGVGVLPDGSKVYVVCADTSYGAAEDRAMGRATADEYFCAVVEPASQEVVRRIPLDAY